MPLPPKVLRKGITDMVRISDARMSGTAYGTVVLHTAPEAADGGPLAAVRSGDFIELDVPNRRLHLDISDAELARSACRRWKRAGAAARERLLEALRRPRAAGRPRAPTSTSWSASAARSCRATTTDDRRPRVHGGGRRRTTAAKDEPYRPCQSFPTPSSRSAFHHRVVTRTEGDTDVFETQDPHRSCRRVGDDLGVRRRRALRRRSRRPAAAAPRGRSCGARRLRLGARLLGLARPPPRLGRTATGSARVTATSTTQPRWEQNGDHWRLHHGAWARGDRDHDGVPNAVDRHPDNPRRP